MVTVRRLAVMLAVGIIFAAAGLAGAARGDEGELGKLPGQAVTVLDKVPQDAHVVIVIKDQGAAEAKLDELVGLFMPTPPAGPDAPANVKPVKPKMELIKKLRTAVTASPELVKANSPLVLLVTFPGKPGDEPLSAALVEVGDFKAFVGEAKADENGIYQIGGKWSVAEYMGLALVGEHAEAVQFYKKMTPGVKLAAGQMELWKGSDAFVTCNLAAVVKNYTPAVEKAHAEAMKDSVYAAAAEVPSGESANSAEAATKHDTNLKASVDRANIIQELWDLAKQADWAAVGVTLDGTAVDWREAFAAKPGTKLAALLSDHPPLGAKLSPDLPKGDCWAVGWYSFDGPRVMKMAGDLCGLEEQFLGSMTQMMGKESPLGNMKDMYAKMQTMLQSHPNMFVGQGAAVAYSASSGGLFNVAGVMACKDSAATRNLMNEYMKMLKDMFAGMDSATASGGVAMPVKVKIAYDQDVQKIGDLSVDRFKETFVFSAPGAGGGGPDQMAMAMVSGVMKNLLGGDSVVGWMTYTDSYAISQMGPNPDRLGDLAKTARDGGGLADDAGLVELRKHTLAESNAVCFVSVSHFTNLMFWNIMSAMTGMPLPPVDNSGAKSKAALSLAAGHGCLRAEFYMPSGETGQLATSVQGVIQRVMAMQGMMQPNKPQQPQAAPNEM